MGRGDGAAHLPDLTDGDAGVPSVNTDTVSPSGDTGAGATPARPSAGRGAGDANQNADKNTADGIRVFHPEALLFAIFSENFTNLYNTRM